MNNFDIRIKELEEYMFEYYEESKADLTHIKKYIEKLEKYKGNIETVLKEVEEITLNLNSLNERCEYSLLETDEREMICSIINDAAFLAGIENNNEDLTEKYREF